MGGSAREGLKDYIFVVPCILTRDRSLDEALQVITIGLRSTLAGSLVQTNCRRSELKAALGRLRECAKEECGVSFSGGVSVLPCVQSSPSYRTAETEQLYAA